MDPDATLDEIAALADKHEAEDGLDTHDTARFVELVTALDTWVSKGGFLPESWAAAAAR